ncbi:MAG TPA: 3-deoxy-7-phosphoheptulonate synthase [Pyrinomonadaceae bacterium]|jgi:3-deoxy-7-phosphoheptulonate synthase
MIVVMARGASEDEIRLVVERLEGCGFQAVVSRGAVQTTVEAVGADGRAPAGLESLLASGNVERIIPFAEPFKLASRQVRQDRTVVGVKGVRIGGPRLTVMAGPCSVESREQLLIVARAVTAAGADILRGGAFKPRTSPYDFQGLGVEGLKLLAAAGEETGLPVVTEVMSVDDVEVVMEFSDMLQVGARNMQNFPLLRRLGKVSAPVLLKRGPSATIKEWLLAAEYLLAGGNANVVLCERGIRTFETELRNTLDLAGVARVKELTHLPVIVDPSHATGRRSVIPAAARAAAAVGADGVMLEVHPEPERALSDGPQALTCEDFALLMQDLRSYWSGKSTDA